MTNGNLCLVCLPLKWEGQSSAWETGRWERENWPAIGLAQQRKRRVYFSPVSPVTVSHPTPHTYVAHHSAELF